MFEGTGEFFAHVHADRLERSDVDHFLSFGVALEHAQNRENEAGGLPGTSRGTEEDVVLRAEELVEDLRLDLVEGRHA